MEKLAENRFMEMWYDYPNETIHFLYKPGVTAEMTDEDFKENLNLYADWAERLQAKRLFVDNRHMQFTISPELQKWVATDIYSRINTIEEIAILLSSDVFAEVATEQALEEIIQVKHLIRVHYFDNKEEAFAWLQSSNSPSAP